jgi:hypothetical protein
MPAPKFYDIATAYGDVVAEALAEQHGLFAHHMLADDGESFHQDKFVVSAISCGYRNAIAPLTDWRAMMPDTPIHPALRTAVRRILSEHEPAGQDDAAPAVPDDWRTATPSALD